MFTMSIPTDSPINAFIRRGSFPFLVIGVICCWRWCFVLCSHRFFVKPLSFRFETAVGVSRLFFSPPPFDKLAVFSSWYKSKRVVGDIADAWLKFAAIDGPAFRCCRQFWRSDDLFSPICPRSFPIFRNVCHDDWQRCFNTVAHERVRERSDNKNAFERLASVWPALAFRAVETTEFCAKNEKRDFSAIVLHKCCCALRAFRPAARSSRGREGAPGRMPAR